MSSVHVDTDVVILAPGRRPVPVSVELSWSSHRPIGVEIAIPNGPEVVVVWAIARDLLVEGLLWPCGMGDVALFPHLGAPGLVELVLSSSAGDGQRVALLVDRVDLEVFLETTCRCLPLHAEEATAAAAADALLQASADGPGV